MERHTLLHLSGLVFGTAYLAATYDSSLAFERPVHSAILVFLVLGLAIRVADSYRLLNVSVLKDVLPPGPAYQRVGKSLQPTLSLRSPFSDRTALIQHLRWHALASSKILTVALCARVLVTLAWLKRIECSFYSVECFLPCLIAAHHLWRSLKAQSTADGYDIRQSPTILSKVQRICETYYGRIALATLAFASSATFVSSQSLAPISTYICLYHSSRPALAVGFQILGLLNDTLIAVCTANILEVHMSGPPGTDGTRTLSSALIIASGTLALFGSLIAVFHPDLRAWIFGLTLPYCLETLKVAFFVTLVVYCGLQLLLYTGFLPLVLVGTLFAVYSADFFAAWSVLLADRPGSELRLLIGLLAMLVAFFITLEYWLSSPKLGLPTGVSIRAVKQTRNLVIAVGTALFLGRVLISASSTISLPSHPIEALILDAGTRHEMWEKENTGVVTLGMAVVHYRDRYGRSPPPNFDKWFEFAAARNSVVIDNFDNVYDDLLPYWSLPPSELRLRTSEDILQPENGVGGIIIRDHKAEVDSGTPGTHRWMLDILITMMSPFVQYLPDMDIPVNINDESRTILEYRARQDAIDYAQAVFKTPFTKRPRNSFDYNKMTRWPKQGEPVEAYRPGPQFQPIFESHGSIHCSARSSARSSLPWQLQRLCTSCQAPHSHPLGPFPTNLSLARDICHQPDMAYLHGTYTAPSTFRAVKELRPIFSQSKAPGFLDIRFPSPWNYDNRTLYAPEEGHEDMDFEEKQNVLIWRGATTEGFAANDGRHAWQGMVRQRLVHAANFPTAQNVLLPDSVHMSNLSSLSTGMTAASWSYQHLSPLELWTSFPTKVSLPFPIARCVWQSCDDQVYNFNRTFPADVAPDAHRAFSADTIDFQDHWKYRYLFDVDGAAFSGRFIAFLQSKSLPIKTTSLFSEWWDGRIREWWHYVPVDPRLSGLWSTLAYFMGVKKDGALGGRLEWAGRQDQAAEIAERGREWANKVLRKEDMEIYLFRLLLEWGRVVDEGRDEIGFTL